MRTFDLAIVGAGIIGAAVAYIARLHRPEWHVVLIDRSLAGDGASRYSAGLDLPFGRTARQKVLSMQSARFYRKLALSNPQLLQDTSFAVVATADQTQEVGQHFAAGELHPASNEERSCVEASYPGLALPNECSLLMGRNARYGVPQRVAANFIQSVRSSGYAECWEGTEVREVNSRSSGCLLELRDGRDVAAERVAIATGPWMLGGPGSEYARAQGMRTKKVAAMHISCRPPVGAPVLYFFREDAFLLPLQEQLLFSFTSTEWDCLPEVSRLGINAGDRELAISVLKRYCPALIPHCNGGRMFCDAYSKDWTPVVASLPGSRNCVLAGACSGSGFRLAPGVALETLQLLDPSVRPEWSFGHEEDADYHAPSYS